MSNLKLTAQAFWSDKVKRGERQWVRQGTYVDDHRRSVCDLAITFIVETQPDRRQVGRERHDAFACIRIRLGMRTRESCQQLS